MAKKTSVGVYILYALPFLVGGTLIYFYFRKRKKLKDKATSGTKDGGTTTTGANSFTSIFYVKTSGSSLNVRQEPSTTSAKVSSLPRGSQIFGRDSGTAGWTEVSQDGITSLGFVSSSFLSSTKPTSTSATTTTTTGGGSDTTSTSGGFTGSGSTTSGTSGVGRPTSFATYTQKYRVSTSSGTLNIRNSPSSSGTIVEKAAKDTVFFGKPSSTTGWIELSKDGKALLGFASNSFLSIVI